MSGKTPKYNFRKREGLKIVFNKNYELSDDDCDYEEILKEDVKENPKEKSEDPNEENSNSSDPSSDSSSDPTSSESFTSRKRERDENLDGFIVDDAEEDNVAFDTSLLSSIIESKIYEKHPALKDRKLNEVIENALKDAEQNLLDRFCDVNYEDNSWKINLPKEEITKLQEVLDEVKKTIEDEEPTMKKILTNDMFPEDRKRLIQMHNIYSNTEKNTREHMEERNNLINQLKHVSDNIEERKKIDTEEKRIMSIDNSLSSSLKIRILNLDAEDSKKKVMLEMYNEMSNLCSDHATYDYLKEKLNRMVSLPYRKLAPLEVTYGVNTQEEINLFYSKIMDKLNNDPDIGLYGMKKAKEAIILALNNRITNPKSTTIIALVSPPGCGKTQLASSLASAIGFPFERISCAGLSDPVHILGSDSTYIGSNSSIFLKILTKFKVANGVVLLDEIDKIANDEKGIATSDALLHALDYTSNHDFRDSYMTEFGHDISHNIYMVSLNNINALSRPLKDRLHIIEVESYTKDDYRQIIKNYLIHRTLKEVGMDKNSVTIDESGINAILNMNIGTEGVRSIQKVVKEIISKLNILRTTGKSFGGISLPNFKLPYVINDDCVSRLIERQTIVKNSMYI